MDNLVDDAMGEVMKDKDGIGGDIRGVINLSLVERNKLLSSMLQKAIENYEKCLAALTAHATVVQEMTEEWDALVVYLKRHYPVIFAETITALERRLAAWEEMIEGCQQEKKGEEDGEAEGENCSSGDA